MARARKNAISSDTEPLTRKDILPILIGLGLIVISLIIHYWDTFFPVQ